MKREEKNHLKKKYEKPQIVYQQSLEEVAAGCAGTKPKTTTVGGECSLDGIAT